MVRTVWNQTQGLGPREFVCGYCSRFVASASGYSSVIRGRGGQTPGPVIVVCPNCAGPTYLEGSRQVPGVAPGAPVAHLPNDVGVLYEEARNCIAGNAPTSAVLACRKLLMNIAVSRGAQTGESFLRYVEFLASNGFVPPDGKGWVDHIRKKGNEANHEIALMSREDATELVAFSEMLLKFIFEFPNRIPKPPAAA